MIFVHIVRWSCAQNGWRGEKGTCFSVASSFTSPLLIKQRSVVTWVLYKAAQKRLAKFQVQQVCAVHRAGQADLLRQEGIICEPKMPGST